MFIDGVGGYDRDGSQRVRGHFLILMQPPAMAPGQAPPIRGVVRTVVLTQFGHFMMGRAQVGKHALTLSGSYGCDGLPCTVPQEVYDKGVELPAELVEAWNNGGGWNGAGSEAPAMREWAKRTFPARGKRR